jgi:voltage-gated potassium channel
MRVLRAIRSVKVITGMVFTNKIKGAAVSLFLLAVLLIVFSAIGVMIYEVGPGTNIRNGNDALWWAVTTITSVGYGDKYPVTTPGRIIGTVLMLGGIALAGCFTACVASVLLESERQKSVQIDILINEVRLLRDKVEALEHKGHTLGPGSGVGPEPADAGRRLAGG